MANYTTNGSGAMNWSNGARWTNTDNSSTGVVPGASDVATIASGHTVTLDQNVTNLGGLAISGGLTWGTAGKTLRMAGDFSISGAGIATFGPNGVLEFDNAGRIWSNLGNWSPPYASVRTSGTTATERFTVRTDTGGTNAYMTAGSRYFLVSFVHVDFLRVGSSSTLAVDATGVTVGEAAAIDDATFEQCGDIWFSGMTDGGLVSDVKFIASLGPLNLQLKDATGVTTVNRCSFDKAPSLSGRGSVYTNNCFHAGFAAAYATTPWSVFDGNLVLQANTNGLVLSGGMTNSLWIVNNPVASADSGIVTSATDHTLTDSSKTWTLDQFSSANPHWMVYITGGAGAGQARRAANNTATTITFSGPSWKTPLDATSTYSIKQGFTYGSQTGIGNGMFDNTTPTVVDGNVWWNIHSDIGGICIAGVSTNRDYLITRNLFLRSLGMNNPGVALQLYSDAPRVSLEHNTFFSGDLAFVQYSPTGETPAGVIKSVRSNLVWCDPDDTTSYTGTYGPRIITKISHTADPENGTLDVVMAGMADYNGDWGLKSGNAGTGYAGNFSVTPGIHDVSGDPGFVNQDASPLTWAAANSYTASVNPLTQLDDFLAAIWADPARIKTSVLPYLRAAMTTTNANLATAAHDGTTIGAVELPSLPAAPSSLTATVVSSTQINLTWTDNSGNETGFALERSLDGTSSWTSINSPTTNTTSYSDTGLASSTAYFYRIKAVNAKGSSSYSSTATAQRQPRQSPSLPQT
ncbi:MAG: fibronectin type III domain-containing protein [Isosphaeraceae bacterium]